MILLSYLRTAELDHSIPLVQFFSLFFKNFFFPPPLGVHAFYISHPTCSRTPGQK